MIRSLTVQNFTIVSEEERIAFAKGLNVVIGENASGKSHLLKLAYTLATISHEAVPVGPDKEEFGRMVGRKLLRVFRPGSLGRLVHHGREKCRVEITFADPAYDYAFHFSEHSRSDVHLDEKPQSFLRTPSILLPTREILSLWPAFTTLYQHHDLGFDATYFDLARALKAPAQPASALKPFHSLLHRLESLMGGSLHYESQHFVLENDGGDTMTIDLVAEGIRKLATLYHLIRNGTLREGSLLFWDEPETNLNPRLIRPLAEILMELSRKGIQVFLATHSLFLLRELEILSMSKDYQTLPQSYITFSLAGGRVAVAQGARIEEVEPIVSLDESLSQSDRYLEME